MQPRRVFAHELAQILNLTRPRISQLKSEGKLRRGPDMKFDLAEALAFRKDQIDENTAQTLLQTYATKAGVHPPKILEHLTSADPDDHVFDEPEAPKTKQTVAEKFADTQTSLTAVRVQAEQLKLERQKVRHAIEDGTLIDRMHVYKSARAAAADVASILDTLEYELGDLFSDPEMQVEARRKARGIIERTLHVLHRKFDELSRPLDGEVVP